MKKVTLYIESDYDEREVSFEDEISIGRTDAARIVLEDEGLSRLNTTFFRDGEDILVVDENSTNGTFVNGKKISGSPQLVLDGDRITLGNNTRIRIKIGESLQSPVVSSQSSVVSSESPKSSDSTDNGGRSTDKKEKPPFVVIASVAAIFLIVFVTLIGFLWKGSDSNGGNRTNTRRTPAKINTALAVPIRVSDPMGGGEPDDNVDDLLSAWEVQEEEIKVEDLDRITSTTAPTESSRKNELQVSPEFFKTQLELSKNHGGKGAEVAGLDPLPAELIGGNVSKQKAKLAELIQRKGYKQPLDFGDLARLRMEGNFVGELPSATNTYVLDIGGSATEAEFTSFDFDKGGRTPLTADDLETLKKLADDFDGQKYDLNNGRDRKQIRIRLLRMYNKESRKLLEEIANEYYQKFKVPLRISSLSRSMDYQIILNGNNPNSFVVRGKGSLPPHTSGCAVDIPRSTLPAAEQNFLMKLFSERERANKLDALREGNANACFHFFIYPDGQLADPTVKFAAIIRTDETAGLFDEPQFWETSGE